MDLDRSSPTSDRPIAVEAWTPHGAQAPSNRKPFPTLRARAREGPEFGDRLVWRASLQSKLRNFSPAPDRSSHCATLPHSVSRNHGNLVGRFWYRCLRTSWRKLRRSSKEPSNVAEPNGLRRKRSLP